MVPAVYRTLSPWENAYLRFETSEVVVRKSLRRLCALGLNRWPAESRILDLFCGSGGGLKALEMLGFRSVEGADLSHDLLARYDGPFPVHRCDCRHLSPFLSGSRDVVVIQGGLHHLQDLRRDVPLVLDEVRRVLAPDGCLAVLEPWVTPFLSFVHRVCRSRLARRISRRIDALATMNDEEGETYLTWLANPAWIRSELEGRFEPIQTARRWGKLLWVGRKREMVDRRP